MKMFKNLTFDKKVKALVIISGLIPVTIVGQVSLFYSFSTVSDLTHSKLVTLRDEKKAQIEEYIHIIEGQIVTFSSDLMIVDAMRDFTDAYKALDETMPESFNLSSLKSRYDYQEKNTKNAPAGSAEEWMVKDKKVQYLQKLYIADNPHKIGEKENLNTSKDGSIYADLHRKYHPAIREYLKTFDYYDIFLVEPKEGRIVYSVFKELDYMTSLWDGPYSHTNFAKVAKKAMKADSPEFYAISDFEPYAPSYNDPAAFIASPIFNGDEKVGVLVFQMPVHHISEVLKAESPIAKSLKTYLIGSDHKLKSDILSIEENTIGKLMNKEGAEAAMNPEGASLDGTGLYGDLVALSGRKLDIKGLDWGIITEAKITEVFSSIIYLMIIYAVLTVVALVVIILSSLYVAKEALAPARIITKLFNERSGKITQANENMSVTSKQMYESASNTTTKSASIKNNVAETSSLTQTIASAIEEMNASVAQITTNIGNSSTGVHSVSESAQQASEQIQALVEASDNIGNVTSLIQDLSDQTNLLALNASIEAARAGDAGRGFAVVADEVRKLAERTNSAVQDIDTQIVNMRSISQKSVEAITQVSSEISSISEEMEMVSLSVSEQNSATNDITNSVGEMVNRISSVEAEAISIEEGASSNSERAKGVTIQTEEVTQEFSALTTAIQDILKKLGIKNS